jgi:hypothetical protein
MEGVAGAVEPPTPTAPHPPQAQKSSVLRPLAIALVLVGLGAGLLYFRGSLRRPEPVEPPRVGALPPLELRGLGYLPPDCNLAFAVQPGPLLAYAERNNQDPRTVLTQAGVPPVVLATLDRLGLPLADIDHVAGGITVPDADLSELRLAFALVLRQPLDEVRFLEQLKAKRADQGGNTWYDVTFAGFPLKLVKVTDRVWVFGWGERDLDPAVSGTAIQLPAGLREVIAARVPPDSAGWVASDTARWTEKKPVAALLQFAAWTPDRIAVLAKGRAATVGVTLGDPPRLHVAVRCADSGSAERLRAYFAEKATAPGSGHGGGGDWATLDLPADPATGFRAVKDMLSDTWK